MSDFCSYSAGMADTPDLDDLAKRYLDLWQEQLRIMAADPETIASVSRLFETMSGAAAAADKSGAAGGMPPVSPNPMAWLAGLGMMPPQGSSGGANPFDSVFAQFLQHTGQASAGATSAGAAPDGGGDELHELKRRLAVLEKRLDAMESGVGGGKAAAKKSRNRKS